MHTLRPKSLCQNYELGRSNCYKPWTQDISTSMFSLWSKQFKNHAHSIIEKFKNSCYPDDLVRKSDDFCDLDETGENLLMKLVTTGEDMLVTLTTTGEIQWWPVIMILMPIGTTMTHDCTKTYIVVVLIKSKMYYASILLWWQVLLGKGQIDRILHRHPWAFVEVKDFLGFNTQHILKTIWTFRMQCIHPITQAQWLLW